LHRWEEGDFITGVEDAGTVLVVETDSDEG
jgi:hypothetical protein